MTIMNAELTYHAKVERASRIEQIIEKIGMGQVIKEVYRHGVYLCLTDTGITIVKDEMRQKVITIYVTTFRELVQCYNGVNKIPVFLRKRVDRNQIQFIKNGKTIWR